MLDASRALYILLHVTRTCAQCIPARYVNYFVERNQNTPQCDVMRCDARKDPSGHGDARFFIVHWKDSLLYLDLVDRSVCRSNIWDAEVSLVEFEWLVQLICLRPKALP